MIRPLRRRRQARRLYHILLTDLPCNSFITMPFNNGLLIRPLQNNWLDTLFRRSFNLRRLHNCLRTNLFRHSLWKSPLRHSCLTRLILKSL